MNNTKLLNRIQELSFFEGIEDIFEILNKHTDRLVFVKSSQGLRNILFLREKNAKSFNDDCFLVLSQESTRETGRFFKDGLIYNLDTIVTKLNSFFSSSEEKLYIEIGFVCTHPNQEILMKTFQTINEDKTRDAHNVMLSYLKYPDWYEECEHAYDIIEVNKRMFEMEKLDQKLNIMAINDYRNKIDEALLNDDVVSFKLYSEKLMKLTSEK